MRIIQCHENNFNVQENNVIGHKQCPKVRSKGTYCCASMVHIATVDFNVGRTRRLQQRIQVDILRLKTQRSESHAIQGMNYTYNEYELNDKPLNSNQKTCLS